MDQDRLENDVGVLFFFLSLLLRAGGRRLWGCTAGGGGFGRVAAGSGTEPWEIESGGEEEESSSRFARLPPRCNDRTAQSAGTMEIDGPNKNDDVASPPSISSRRFRI